MPHIKLGEIECNLDCTVFISMVKVIHHYTCQRDCVILSASSFLCDGGTIEFEHQTDVKSNDNDNDFNINFNTDDIINKLYNDPNPIIILQLNGKQIRLAIIWNKHAANNQSNDENKLPHIWGLRIVYNLQNKNGNKVESINILNFIKLTDSKIYSFTYVYYNGNNGIIMSNWYTLNDKIDELRMDNPDVDKNRYKNLKLKN